MNGIMKLIIILLAGVFMLTTGSSEAFARKKNQTKNEKVVTDSLKTPAKKRNTQYPRLFRNKKVVTKKGVITIHKINDKLYFEFPTNLMGRDFLINSSISATNDSRNGFVGQTMETPLHVRFAIQGDNVYMQNVTPVSKMNVFSDQADISEAIAKSNIIPDMEAFKLAAYNMDSTAVVFEVTKFFFSDNKRLPLFDKNSLSTRHEKLGTMERRLTLKKDLSSIRDFHAFDDNLEISLDMSFYQTMLVNKREVQGENVRVKAVYSLLLLSEEVMPWRLADPRVGYTFTSNLKISTEKDGTALSYLQHKWNLQPADEKALQHGDLVTPRKQIVFYIDSDFPDSWKSVIKEGVESWNEAFRMAGFKDAVRAVDFPKNDSLFYVGNLKYSCIRYVPGHFSDVRSTVWVDPRSGEIINGSIFIGHDIIKQIVRDRFIQTAQVDERVRDTQIPEALLMEGLKLRVMHEVGHCLGLADNVAASASYPTESLRSVDFTRENGIASSVMDKLPYNYIAQPKDGKVVLCQNRLGKYDLYAIQMGYMLIPEAKTPEEVKEKIGRWIAMKSGDPVFRYGKKQYIDAEYDPSALQSDLGANAVKSSRYGVDNLRYILANMDGWLEQHDTSYQFRVDIYPAVVSQYQNYLTYALRNVGGFYLTEHIVGDKNQALAIVPKASQREAARWVMEELCNMEWLDAPSVQCNQPVRTPVYQKVIKNFAENLINTKRISLSYYRDPKSYSPEEYINDLYQTIWASTIKGRSLNRAELMLQYEVVVAVLKKLQLPNHMSTDIYAKKKGAKVETLLRNVDSDVNTVGGFGPLGYVTNLSNDNQKHLLHGFLIRVQKLMESKLNVGSYETRMHYGQLLEKIEDIRNW